MNKASARSPPTHIAAHLGISPGNLYYHFRKEDIVHQIFLEYRQFVRQRLTWPTAASRKWADVLGYLDTAFDGMWRYRFMFYDLPGLLAQSGAATRLSALY